MFTRPSALRSRPCQKEEADWSSLVVSAELNLQRVDATQLPRLIRQLVLE